MLDNRAKSGQVIAPAKAEALLDLLETQYKACYHSSVSIQNDDLHDMMPNTVSYTTVISAWARRYVTLVLLVFFQRCIF